MIVGVSDGDPVEVPFDYQHNLLSYSISEPTMEELDTLPIYCITSDDPWHPSDNGYHSVSHLTSDP